MILNRTYSCDEIFQDMKELAQIYTDFTLFRTVGISHDERPIPLLRVGLGIDTLVLTAGVHGRESVNPVLLTKLAEEYCSAYSENRTIEGLSVRELLNRCSICILPLVNPDGYETALCGFDVIRNPILRQYCKIRNIDAEHWKYNARGVDINRNFPCKSYIQQQLGEYPSSENETRALIKVFEEYDTVGYIDFHSRGRIIYYYRQAMPFSYNQRNHKLARYMQKLSNYTIGKKEEEYMSQLNGGSPVNYYSELLKKPAITVETIEETAGYPLDPSYQEKTFQEIHLLPLEIINKT
jgi:g-D-glutamyl-meso-diaminopimelate peptidase